MGLRYVPRCCSVSVILKAWPKSNSDSDSSEEWGGFDLMDDDGDDAIPKSPRPVATTSSRRFIGVFQGSFTHCPVKYQLALAQKTTPIYKNYEELQKVFLTGIRGER